jgi:hypothetical protein
MVLSMVTMANAALRISVNGQVDPPDSTVFMLPSETVTIGIVGVLPQPGNYTLWLIANPIGVANLSGGGIVWSHQDTVLSDFIYYSGTNEAHIAMLRGPGMGFDVDSGLFIAAFSSAAPTPDYDGTIADNIVVHCNNWCDVKLTLLHVIEYETGEVDENFNPIFEYSPEVFDTQVIHAIPEPMTLGLLGLGGLFLRRRK